VPLRPKIVERRDDKRGFVVSRRLAASVSKLCYGDLLAIGRPDSGGQLDQEPNPAAHLRIWLRKAVLARHSPSGEEYFDAKTPIGRILTVLAAMKGGGTDGLRTRRTALTPLCSPIRRRIGDGGDDPRGVST